METPFERLYRSIPCREVINYRIEFELKQFTVSFTIVVFYRIYKDSLNGNCLPGSAEWSALCWVVRAVHTPESRSPFPPTAKGRAERRNSLSNLKQRDVRIFVEENALKFTVILPNGATIADKTEQSEQTADGQEKNLPIVKWFFPRPKYKKISHNSLSELTGNLHIPLLYSQTYRGGEPLIPENVQKAGILQLKHNARYQESEPEHLKNVSQFEP